MLGQDGLKQYPRWYVRDEGEAMTARLGSMLKLFRLHPTNRVFNAGTICINTSNERSDTDRVNDSDGG